MRDYLIKFSREKEHLSEFMEKGRIYANRTDYYSKCEAESDGRYDKFEAVTSYHQPEGASIKLDGRSFPIKGNFGYREGAPDFSHLFCLYGLSDESIGRSEQGKVFDERLWDEFGEYIVFIHDAHSFIRRLNAKLKETNVRFKNGYVEYFCPHTFEGQVGAFKKRNTYSHQEEFRIAIDGPELDGPIEDLYLGDVSDIAYGPVRRSKSENLYDGNRIVL